MDASTGRLYGKATGACTVCGQWVAPELDGSLDLASGRIDALFDDTGYAWDLAPIALLVEEAGGRFVDPFGGRRIDRFGGWFTNGRLGAALGDLGPLSA